MSNHTFGMRYKQYVVYCDKEPNENINSFISRMWFVVRNVRSAAYDVVVTYSKYFVNIDQKKIKYPADVHTSLSEMFV